MTGSARARARPAGAARLGDVRLGQLRVQTTVIIAVFPRFFSDTPRRAGAGRRHRAFAWATTIAVTIVAVIGPDPGRHRGLPRAEEAPARRLHGDRRRRHAADGHHRRAASGCIALDPVHRRRTSASRRAWSSTTRCCRTSPGPTRWTASRRRATPSATFGGGVLLLVTWRGSSAADVRAARYGRRDPKLSFVSVGVWWLLFSMPLFRRVPEPPAVLEADETAENRRSRGVRRGAGRRSTSCAATGTRS